MAGCGVKGAGFEARHNCHHDSKINGRLCNPNAACQIDVSITPPDLHAKPFFQYRHQQIDAVKIRSGRLTAWNAKIAVADERLNLREHRTSPLH